MAMPGLLPAACACLRIVVHMDVIDGLCFNEKGKNGRWIDLVRELAHACDG
jgi:hypothetical protein